MPPDSFWQAMARCETGNNWQNGGEYAGGLGIYVGTWRQWGGREFAPTPDQATPAQQIVVANRVSTQGWKRPDGRFEPPVGFSGWGCLKTIGRPTLMMFTPESLLAQRFRWLQRGQAVRDLQLLLGLPVDGVYRDRTAVRHREILEQRGLPISLAASAPASSPSTAAASDVATTAPMPPTPDAAGVPANTASDGAAAAVAAESPTTPDGAAPAAETPAAGPAEPAATAPSGEPAPATEPPPEGAR
jgi:hypothetical protein